MVAARGLEFALLVARIAVDRMVAAAVGAAIPTVLAVMVVSVRSLIRKKWKVAVAAAVERQRKTLRMVP